MEGDKNKPIEEVINFHGTKVMFHGCPHTFQDERYGKNQRVFNKTKLGWRCTVCGGNVT